MGDKAAADSFIFSAFISYARKDRAEAVYLQRRLEQYRLDADLRIKEGQRYFQRKPLQPVFRDEDELVPGQNLPERIQKGLAGSRFLIVLASRSAVQSQWVEKEILDFMALGKGDRIITLVIDGEPNAARSGKAPALECLPRPFRLRFDNNREPTQEPVAEPNWVDWRGSRKRSRLNFLRLVAALLELDRFDDLVHRDERTERRRLRFAQSVAAGMIALFVLAALGGWIAWRQRNGAFIAESNFIASHALALGAPNGDWRIGDAARATRLALEGAPSAQGGVFDRPATSAIDGVLRTSGPIVDRLLVLLHGHRGTVASAVFSPDGSKILTASEDRTAKVWNAADGKLLATLRGHGGQVTSAAFSPNGSRIITTSADGAAHLWDVATLTLISALKGHSAAVNLAMFSRDGEKIVTASADHTARIWNGRDGTPIATLSGHSESVDVAAFSPDGRQVVTGSGDKSARVWDLGSGKSTLVLSHSEALSSATFSPDGTLVLTSIGKGKFLEFDDAARVWDAKDGHVVTTVKGAGVNTAEFSPDGKTFITAVGTFDYYDSNRDARVWDTRTGKLVTTLFGHGSGVTAASFTSDGRKILTASLDGTLRLWDSKGELLVVLGERETHLLDPGVPGDREIRVLNASLSLDGRKVVAASGDNVVRTWDLFAGEPQIAVSGNAAELSPDGRMLLASMSQSNVDIGTAQLIDAQSGKALFTFVGSRSNAEAGAFSPDGARVITVSGDGIAHVWSTRDGKALLELKGLKGSITSAMFSPDGKKILISSYESKVEVVRLWDAADGKELMTLRARGDATFLGDGQKVLVRSKPLKVWDIVSGKVTAVSMPGDSLLAMSPDGGRVVTLEGDPAYDANAAMVRKFPSGQIVAMMRGHSGNIMAAAFSPDGKQIVTASQDTTVRVWDAYSGRQIALLSGHKSGVQFATFSPDGRMILTSSQDPGGPGDYSTRLWSASDGKPVTVLRGEVFGFTSSAVFSRDGTKILAVRGDQTSIWLTRDFVWPETEAALTRRACASLVSRYGAKRLPDVESQITSRAADAPHPCRQRGLLDW